MINDKYKDNEENSVNNVMNKSDLKAKENKNKGKLNSFYPILDDLNIHKNDDDDVINDFKKMMQNKKKNNTENSTEKIVEKGKLNIRCFQIINKYDHLFEFIF